MSLKEQFYIYYSALRLQRRRSFYVYKPRERHMFELFDKETQGVDLRIGSKEQMIFCLNF